MAALSFSPPYASPNYHRKSKPKLKSKLIRSALVEARPVPFPLGDENGFPASMSEALTVVARDRTTRAEDLQAEARAMARAVNASVYSPQLVKDKYGSQPFKQ